MECPHCHEEIPGKACPECGITTPIESQYCMQCGAYLDEDEAGTSDSEAGDDFDDRVLCPDGTCTGIIVDGKCSECGKASPVKV